MKGDMENAFWKLGCCCLDDDSENRLVGEDHEYGREIGAKREPDSEDEEKLGIDWEDAHEIPLRGAGGEADL